MLLVAIPLYLLLISWRLASPRWSHLYFSSNFSDQRIVGFIDCSFFCLDFIIAVLGREINIKLMKRMELMKIMKVMKVVIHWITRPYRSVSYFSFLFFLRIVGGAAFATDSFFLPVRTLLTTSSFLCERGLSQLTMWLAASLSFASLAMAVQRMVRKESVP